MKTPIKLVLAVAALSLGLAAPVTRAQEEPPSPPKGEHPGRPEAHKGPRGDRLKMLAEKLNLTDEQKEKIKPILADEAKAIKAVRDDQSLEREAKWTKIREIGKAHNAQIRPLLTPEQQKQLDEMKEEFGRGPGGPRKEK